MKKALKYYFNAILMGLVCRYVRLKLGNNIFIPLSEKRKSAIFVFFCIHIQIGRS